MKTDSLMDLLAADTAAQPPARPAQAFALAVIAAVALAAAILWTGLGVRFDIGLALEQLRFLFKWALVLVLAVTGCGLVLRLMRPEARPGRWVWLLLLLPAALAMGVAVELIAVPPEDWSPRAMGNSAAACLVLIPLMAAGPLAFLLLALRRGAPASPALAGAAAGLAAAGIAASFYAVHCRDDSPLFVALWYGLATLAVTLAGAGIGARVLRW